MKSNHVGKTQKTALIIGPGGLRGAYNAGVAVGLGRALGTDWVDGVYASSVGVYMTAFFAAKQFHPIEHVWRNLVHGDQLVDITKLSQGRNWLDLEYLVQVLNQEDKNTRLDVSEVISSSVAVTFTLTRKRDGESVYVQPEEDNLFSLMTASCAVPWMHPPVKIDGEQYIDGGLSDPLPVDKAFADGYNKLIVIDETPVGSPPSTYAMWWLSFLFASPLSKKVADYGHRNQSIKKRAAC